MFCCGSDHDRDKVTVQLSQLAPLDGFTTGGAFGEKGILFALAIQPTRLHEPIYVVFRINRARSSAVTNGWPVRLPLPVVGGKITAKVLAITYMVGLANGPLYHSYFGNI